MKCIIQLLRQWLRQSGKIPASVRGLAGLAQQLGLSSGWSADGGAAKRAAASLNESERFHVGSFDGVNSAHRIEHL